MKIIALFLAVICVNAFSEVTGTTCELDAWKTLNGYFYNASTNGPNCVVPNSCATWPCPRITSTSKWQEPYQDKKSDVEEMSQEHAKIEEEIDAQHKLPISLPPGTITKKGKVWELSEGTFPVADFKDVPANTALIGKGEKSIIVGPGMIPLKTYLFQDLTLRDVYFPHRSAWEKEKIFHNVLVRVKADLFAYGISGLYDGWDSVILIQGSFGMQAPKRIHKFSSLAFGTHVKTLVEGGDRKDLYANPQWIPEGDMKNFIGELAKGEVNKESAQKALEWPTPSTFTQYQTLGIEVLKNWIRREFGVTAVASAEDKAKEGHVEKMEKDLEEGRFLSSLVRVALLETKDVTHMVRRATTRDSARQKISQTYSVDPRIGTSNNVGPQNAQLTGEKGDYARLTTDYLVEPLAKTFESMMPVASLGVPAPPRAIFTTHLDLDVWQVEKRVKKAFIEKTEWLLSAQGQAKQTAAMNAGLSNLGKSFDAAGASMQNTWKNFEAYRTRIETNQSGETYLKSYKGDINAGNSTGLTELENLRKQIGSQSGPGAAGDYYPVTTYAIEATRKYRHQMKLRYETQFTGKEASNGRSFAIDKSWELGVCTEKFTDNSAYVYPSGTNCWVSDGAKGLAEASNRLKLDFQGYVKTQFQPFIESEMKNLKATGKAEMIAEAALYHAVQKTPLSADEKSALKKVFGDKVTPQNAATLLVKAKNLE